MKTIGWNTNSKLLLLHLLKCLHLKANYTNTISFAIASDFILKAQLMCDKGREEDYTNPVIYII